MYRLLAIFLLLSANFKLAGQQSMSFRYADSLTFSLYSDKNWEELIYVGKKALDNGHDFYYLRMRLGIACYEKHNYANAVIHFRKALAFNENDQIAIEYLFYSYYLSGRSFQAWSLLQSSYVQVKDRILKESGIKRNSLTIESFFSDARTNKFVTNPENYFTNPEPGSQIATKYFINNAFYASHMIGKKTNYFHSFTNLIKENYLHYYDGTSDAELTRQKIIQNQYYGSLNIFSTSGWVFSPAIHFLTVRYPFIYFANPGIDTTVSSYNIRNNSFVAGAGVKRTGGFISIGAEVNYSNLNKVEQVQGTVTIMVYPAGNNSLYFGGRFSSVIPLNQTSSSIRYVSGITAGFSVRSKIWFELTGVYGDMKNYTENNGLFIFNSFDILRGKLLGRVIIPFKKPSLSLLLGGGISWYSSEYIPSDGIISFDSNKFTYTNNIFTGGISWDF